MFLSQKFPILIAHLEIGSPTVAGTRLAQLKQELEQNGWRAIAVNNPADAQIIAGAHRGLSAIVASSEAANRDPEVLKRLVGQLKAVHERAPGLPIIAIGSHGTVAEASPAVVEALRELHSILYLYEDTVPFLARQVMRAASDYLDTLLPPFFKALVRHAERSAYSWHTPGHAGGVGFTKSAAGFALHEFFGENTLRSDLSISVPELGSLLDHTGPVKAAASRRRPSASILAKSRRSSAAPTCPTSPT